MQVKCIDNSANGRNWLTNGAIYHVSDVVQGKPVDFYELAETGTMLWWASRFRPVNDNEKFLSGADIESEQWDNRRVRERV